MKIRIICVIVVALTVASQAFATAQRPDRIIYNGKHYSLLTNPMEEYFKKFPEKKPKGGLISTGLWRGYLATFEISGQSLLLNDIEIMVSKDIGEGTYNFEFRSVLNDVVTDGKKLKIDWYSGLLVLPHGKIVNYVHMGYASTYENYILIEVENGEFKKAKEFNHKQYKKFKTRQFEAFKKTQEYRDLVEKIRKEEGSDPKFIDSYVKNFVVEYSSKILVN